LSVSGDIKEVRRVPGRKTSPCRQKGVVVTSSFRSELIPVPELLLYLPVSVVHPFLIAYLRAQSP